MNNKNEEKEIIELQEDITAFVGTIKDKDKLEYIREYIKLAIAIFP